MKCPNCQNDLLSTFRCRYCSKLLCSLQCLEHHFSKFHILKINPPSNVNSPYLIKGFLNNTIIYDSFYSLDNYVPIYDENGKVQIVGSGSYGQVYLAMNILDKKYYAIKHMDKKKLFNLLHSLTSIQKEIDIQSKLDHPNIVKLLFVKETHLSYDLVMEYASNGSLFHYIRKYKGLDENKTFSLFIQVVNAVNFMHSNDLIHRDIKPENILLFDNNNIRLCDFGWCVKLDGHQRGTFCGTTEYMSPELVNHEGYGKEIDVWSLGILLYEMIHGYSPFRPNKPKFNEKDVMENIKNHKLIFGKTVSEECKQLIYHLLDPDINKRYNVEDIFNSDFVKKYEKLHLYYPDYNLIRHYNGIDTNNSINNNNQKLNISNNIINKNDENININNINNIMNSKAEIDKTNSFNNNLIYPNNNDNNFQIQDSRNMHNIYNNNINEQKKNLTAYDLNLNRNIYFDYMHNNNSYNQIQNKINNNDDLNKLNNISLSIDNNNNNQKNIIKNNNYFYENKENLNIIHLQNIEKHPQDNISNIDNYNNNSFFIITSDNNKKNNDINNIINNNINYINEIKDITNQQYNMQNQQLYNNNLNNIIPATNNSNNNNKMENNSINYNYYYNFNNYNNNYTNNYFNNSYNQISQSPSSNIQKKISISNYNVNSLNNSNINIINKTPSTTSNNTNIIKENNKKKISEFEIGEDKYNLSDKEQNENDLTAIKININHEQQKINNRKYLSRSDYSIINKNKKEEKSHKNNKSIFIKKLDIDDIKIDHLIKHDNSYRYNEKKKDDINNVEQYLLKNKLYKNQLNSGNNKINLSNPNIDIKISNFNINKKQTKSKSFYENKKDQREIKNKLINKENIQIKKVNNNNYVGDILCSLFNAFDSNKDKKNEVNITKKDSNNNNYINNNKYNVNTYKALNTKLSNKDNIVKNKLEYTKSNSFIKAIIKNLILILLHH